MGIATEASFKKHIPGLIFKTGELSFQPTIDIDSAWAYRNKGLIRTIGGYLKDLRSFDIPEMKKRTRVLFKLEKDPFDTYGLMHEIHQSYSLRPVFFILFADYGLNDKNVPVNNDRFQTLIKSLADYSLVGIHPSSVSNKNPALLANEIGRLSSVVSRNNQQPPTFSYVVISRYIPKPDQPGYYR